MLKKGDKILIIFFAFYGIVCGVLQMGVLQKVEYYLYSKNLEKYTVITASVKKTHEIGYSKVNAPNIFFKWKWTDITYEYNNLNYDRVIHSYPELMNEENILIAVKDGNPKKVLRCIPYDITEQDKKQILSTLVAFIVVVLYFLLIRILRERQYRSTYKFLSKENDDEQESETYQIAKKKLRIMSSVKGCEEVSFDKELVMKLDNPIHEDFIWCLKYLSKTNVADDILLLHMNADGDYEFVVETIGLRQHGLLEQYYVIAKADNKYLCGSADSHRVYCFSQSLGVTNTQYATIFDYIIEKLGL